MSKEKIQNLREELREDFEEIKEKLKEIHKAQDDYLKRLRVLEQKKK